VGTINAINTQGPVLLDSLYSAIKSKLSTNDAAIAVPYANPFPAVGRAVGPNCPYMTNDEILAANNFVTALNTQIKAAAGRHGFTYAELGSLFKGKDVCGTQPAFYNVDPNLPQATWLHPNKDGQTRYAGALGVAILRAN
jgi:hypothetical protein